MESNDVNGGKKRLGREVGGWERPKIDLLAATATLALIAVIATFALGNLARNQSPKYKNSVFPQVQYDGIIGTKLSINQLRILNGKSSIDEKPVSKYVIFASCISCSIVHPNLVDYDSVGASVGIIIKASPGEVHSQHYNIPDNVLIYTDEAAIAIPRDVYALAPIIVSIDDAHVITSVTPPQEIKLVDTAIY